MVRVRTPTPALSCRRSGASGSRSPPRASVPPASRWRCPASRPRRPGGSRGRRGARLVVYLWDLPPAGTGSRAPRSGLVDRRTRSSACRAPGAGTAGGAGYYSRLRYIAARADARLGAQHAHARDGAERFGVRAGAGALLLRLGPLRPRSPRGRQPRPRPPMLLTVSRLRPHKNQAAVLQAAARARPAGPGATHRPRAGAARARGARRPAGRALHASRPTADDADGHARLPRGGGRGLSQPVRGIRPHADRGGRLGGAGRGVRHPAAPRVRRPRGAAGAARRSCRRSPRRSRRALDGAAGRSGAGARISRSPRPPRDSWPPCGRSCARLGHGHPPAADLRFPADRRRHRALDGRARQALSGGLAGRVHRAARRRVRRRTPASPTGSIACRFPRAGSARIQGILLWSRRVAVLARSTDAEFIWCGNIKPAAYPAKWTMERTGTPFGILLHGGDLLILQHQVHQSAIKRKTARGAALLGGGAGGQQRVDPRSLPHAAERARHRRVARPGARRAARAPTTQFFRPGLDTREVRARYGLERGPLAALGRAAHAGTRASTPALQALARLGRRYPDLRYAVVGTGEEHEALAAEARELGVADRVRFLTDVPDRDLPALYNCAEIYLGVSRLMEQRVEGFGISLAEASACGVPVIAGRSGGIPGRGARRRDRPPGGRRAGRRGGRGARPACWTTRRSAPRLGAAGPAGGREPLQLGSRHRRPGTHRPRARRRPPGRRPADVHRRPAPPPPRSTTASTGSGSSGRARARSISTGA